MFEIGRMWHINKTNVAQEHYATAVTQFIMSLLYEKIFLIPHKSKTLLGTCVSGELHELGIRMLCDYFESMGWDTYYFGANMPDNDIVDITARKSPDIVAISCTMTYNILKVKELIFKIKSQNKDIRIMVGGYTFNIDETLWKKVGADDFSIDFESAYNNAHEYLGRISNGDK